MPVSGSALALLRRRLQSGLVIPACPLALDRARHLDVCRQRALVRYYVAAGAGGLAVGVHTTQFAIHDPGVGLYRPLLELVSDTVQASGADDFVRVAGLVGGTDNAVREAKLAASLGYDCGLLSLSAFRDAPFDEVLQHCEAVAEVIPLFGFYLQPAVGGMVLPHTFWRRFVDIERVLAIKVAPFNRYQTLDVVRAVAESGRAHEVALYTGNDDHIVGDLVTRYDLPGQGRADRVHIVGGLLGQWAVWTRTAVELLETCRRARSAGQVPAALLALGTQVTDCNAAFFDVAHSYAGCIAGLHEVLRRQGLMEGCWCLDPDEGLSPGQEEEIDRVYRTYPHLNDDGFVAAHLDEWLA